MNNTLKNDIEFSKKLFTDVSAYNSNDDTRFESVMTQVSSFEYPLEKHHSLTFRFTQISAIAASLLLVFASGYYFGKQSHSAKDNATIPAISQKVSETSFSQEIYFTLFSSLQIFQSDNTIIENIITNQSHHKIFLKKGKLSLQFLPRFPNETVEIVTDKGNVHVIGTIFSVDIKDTLRVSVAKGKVRVTNNKHIHTITEGEILEDDTIQIFPEEAKKELIIQFAQLPAQMALIQPINTLPSQKEVPQAKKIHQAVAQPLPINPEELYHDAEQKIQSKDYQGAVIILKKIVEADVSSLLTENAYAELIRIYEKYLTDIPLCLQLIEQYLEKFQNGIFILELKEKHCFLAKTQPNTFSPYCKKN